MANENPDVTITMRVDCPGLTSDPKGISNVKNYIDITDTLGDTEDEKGNVTTFDTKVYSSARIVWEGKSSDGIDSVHITRVYEKEGEVNCFEKGSPYPVNDGSENWEGIALNVEDSGDIECEYLIDFTINGDHTTYTLDPKLQIKKKN